MKNILELFRLILIVIISLPFIILGAIVRFMISGFLVGYYQATELWDESTELGEDK